MERFYNSPSWSNRHFNIDPSHFPRSKSTDGGERATRVLPHGDERDRTSNGRTRRESPVTGILSLLDRKAKKTGSATENERSISYYVSLKNPLFCKLIPAAGSRRQRLPSPHANAAVKSCCCRAPSLYLALAPAVRRSSDALTHSFSLVSQSVL